MNLRITVLVENTAGRVNVLGEHGLSLWIEAAGRSFLMDTGQGGALAANAAQLGVDLARAEAIVLSHGHYDHTGGLVPALDPSRRTRVYAHRAAFGSKFVRHGGTTRDIAIPATCKEVIRQRADVTWVEGPVDLGGGLRLTGPVPRVTDYEDTGGAFFTDAACTQPDALVDDQAAFLETDAGTAVMLGCAHSGVINTLRYVQSLTGGRRIHTVLGGMHLGSASPERMERTVAELRKMNVERLMPCHCTGLAATVRLWSELPGRCVVCAAGTVFEC